MKPHLITGFLLMSLNLYAQWTPVDTITPPTDCWGGLPLQIGFFISDNDNAFLFRSREACSPSATAYFSITRTPNSFFTYQGYKGCGNGYLKDAAIITTDTGYVFYDCFGPTGKHFEKTVNGGVSWTPLSTDRPDRLCFVNGHLAYGFRNDSLFRFYNDSISLVNTVTNFTIDYYTLYFFDSLRGMLLLQPSQFQNYADTIMRTTDGGQTWSQLIIDPARTFTTYNLQEFKDSIIFIHADSGYIFKSRDAGATWTLALHNPTTYIRFINEQKAYAVTGSNPNAYFQISNDSGKTWSWYLIPPGYTAGYPDVKMVNDTVGYMWSVINIGGSYKYVMLKTTNGGIPATPPPPCNAEFTHNSLTGTTSVQFNPIVTSAISYYWSFGDGNYSTTHDLSHLYAPGTYNACLTVLTSPADTCTWCDSILVIAPPLCNAHFSHSSLNNPDSMQFYPEGGTSAISYSWNFDDGTYSNLPSPWHLFTRHGVYNTCLTIHDANESGTCSATWCNNIVAPLMSADVTITPVPVNNNNYATIYLRNTQAVKLKIYDNSGRIILNFDNVTNGSMLNLASLRRGLYFYEAYDVNGINCHGKLVVMR